MTDTDAVPTRWRLGPDSVPRSRYVDGEFLEAELERLFPRVWINACRLEEVDAPGRYVELVVGDDPVVVVRTDDGSVRAFHNSCRHRGTRLVRGHGRIGEFRCPFHAWRWGLDGSFRHRPDDEHFTPVAPEELCLRECRAETWGGWVFINLDPDAEPLAEFLAPLPERLEGFGLERMRYRWHKRFPLPANWKTAIDAFVEAYHVPGTHPQFLRPSLTPSTPAALAETGLWPPSVNELHGRHARTLKPIPDPEQRPAVAEAVRRSGMDALEVIAAQVDYQLRELGSLNTEWDRAALDRLEGTELPEDPGELAGLISRTRREVAAEQGVELPDLSREQVRAGAYDWLVFPNTVLLVTGNVGSLLGYRALPDGHDPHSCVFDVWSMQLYAPGREPAVEIEEYDDWRDAEVGEVLSQDFANLAEVTAGMRSRSFDRLVLNTRQEMSILHHHRVADDYLFGA